jgi:hypothetical protein
MPRNLVENPGYRTQRELYNTRRFAIQVAKLVIQGKRIKNFVTNPYQLLVSRAFMRKPDKHEFNKSLCYA